MLKIRVQNAASFKDSEEFEIKPGINAFIGINNSGKSALLWALAMLGGVMREEKSAWFYEMQSKMDGYRRGATNPGVQIEFALPSEMRDQRVAELCSLAGMSSYPSFDVTRETFEFNVRLTRSRQVAFARPIRLHYNSGDKRVPMEIASFPDHQTYFVNPLFGGNFPNTFRPQPFQVQQMAVMTTPHIFVSWTHVPASQNAGRQYSIQYSSSVPTGITNLFIQSRRTVLT
jgi:hypothetical protein